MRTTAQGSALFVALLVAGSAAAAAPVRAATPGTVRVIRQPAATATTGHSGEAAFRAESRSPSATSFFCTPNGVAVFENRVHIHCTTADSNGVSYFAYPNTDAAQTARVLSLLLVAYTTTSPVYIYYDPNDTSGSAWGCQVADCRVFTGASMVR